MPCRVMATMVTTTTYGTWLPGDMRGYVQDGVILPPNPALLRHVHSLLSKAPVYLNSQQQGLVHDALVRASAEFNYLLTDVSVETWHLHWIVSHGYDRVDVMVGRLKTRMRQALKIGRVWTVGYCHRCLFKDREVETARRYIARHAGCRMTNGQPRQRDDDQSGLEVVG